MPSLKCHQCGKVKQCNMYQVRTEPECGPFANTWLSGAIEYLCRPCARELGYREPKS